MADTCTHLDTIETKEASGPGCVECLKSGGRWLHRHGHLRRGQLSDYLRRAELRELRYLLCAGNTARAIRAGGTGV